MGLGDMTSLLKWGSRHKEGGGLEIGGTLAFAYYR